MNNWLVDTKMGQDNYEQMVEDQTQRKSIDQGLNESLASLEEFDKDYSWQEQDLD